MTRQDKQLVFYTAIGFLLVGVFIFWLGSLTFWQRSFHGSEWKQSVRVPACRADQNIEVIYPSTYQAGEPQTVTIECND